MPAGVGRILTKNYLPIWLFFSRLLFKNSASNIQENGLTNSTQKNVTTIKKTIKRYEVSINWVVFICGIALNCLKLMIKFYGKNFLRNFMLWTLELLATRIFLELNRKKEFFYTIYKTGTKSLILELTIRSWSHVF